MKRPKKLILILAVLLFALMVIVGIVYKTNPYAAIPVRKTGKPKRVFPDELVTEAPSPDRINMAQILREPQSKSYYLRIINRRHQTAFLFDRNLLPGAGNSKPVFHIAWRGTHKILIEIDPGSNKNFEFYAIDSMYWSYDKLDKIPPELIPKKEETFVALGKIPLKTDDDKMKLYKRIVPGISYKSLKSTIPALSDLHDEAAAAGLTEAFLDLEILGYPVQVEFNFRYREMYNFYYRINASNSADAEAAYRKLQTYFTLKYGSYTEERTQEEPSYTVESSHWDNGKTNVSLYNDVSPGGKTLTFSIGGI